MPPDGGDGITQPGVGAGRMRFYGRKSGWRMSDGQDAEARQTNLHNQLSGYVHGSVVQAGSIGQVIFHGDEIEYLVPRQLPPSPRQFVGRARQLETLGRWLAENDGQPLIVMLSGMGGVGKTALALHWLHALRDQFPDGQLYVDLGAFSTNETVQPADALEWFLLALGLPAKRMPIGLASRAALYRSMTVDRSMAVLLDNALSAAQVRPLLPSSAASVVVVTSRWRLSGLAMCGAQFVDVDPLDVPTSVELLSKMVGDNRLDSQHDDAEELARLCGGIPIALSVTGARLSARPHRSLQKEVVDLRSKGPFKVLSLTPEISIQALFDMSYESLPPTQARVYRLCAWHTGTTFGVDVAAAMTEQTLADTENALEALAEQNLISEVGECRFRYHDLLIEHARLLTAPTVAEPTVRRTVDWYLDMAVTADLVLRPSRRRIGERYQHPLDPSTRFGSRREAYAWLALERANLVQAVEAADRHRWNQLVWEFCEALWGFYLHARPYNDWLHLHALGIAAAQRCGHAIAEARLRVQLGAALTSLRRFDDSMRENLTALRLAEQEDDESTRADALLELASVAQGMGHLDMAVDYFRQVKQIREVIGTPRAVALCRRRMGEVLTDLGRLDEAVTELKAAAKAMVHLDTVQVARALTSLGTAYLKWDRPAEAQAALTAAMELADNLGSPHYLAAVLTGLGDVAERTGDLSLASQYREQAYRIYADSGDPRAADLVQHLPE
jgi:tetratricopeptide (TPR) repeat protein